MSEQTKKEQEIPDQEKEAAAETAAGSGAEPAQEAASAPAEQPAQEKTEAEKLKEQLDALNDRYLRVLAEYDNFRKRSQREKESIYPQATMAAVTQFVPILDTFERALGAPCSDQKFKQGVEMILTNFKDALKKIGVEEFGEVGNTFDPEMHNALMHVDDDKAGAGAIVEVFQKGYKLGDRIIRHAVVKVAN